ncbi:MAG TPA: hypothetical protein VIN40_02915 [Candidatus Tyrphobacter sp.]
MIVELLGTHLCLNIGAWRLRFAFAIEDADLQPPASAAPARDLRPASDEKLDRIFPNRR